MNQCSSATLSLREASELIPFEIDTDGRFATLGFLSDLLESMFTFVEHPRFLRRLEANRCVSAVIVSPELAGAVASRLDGRGTGVAISSQPRRTFFALQNALARTSFYGLDAPADVHPSAQIHAAAVIAERGVRIDTDVVVGAGAVIGRGTCIERGAVVHPGAVLGAAGFQTLRADGDYVEMAHCGGVHIGADALVFANATIARGLFRQDTAIGARTRIGNNVFVSHNVKIGECSFIGHGAVVNGSVRIGRECWIGPAAVVSNGISIGDKAHVSLGSVVVHDLEAGAHVSGNFAVPHQPFLRHVSRIR